MRRDLAQGGLRRFGLIRSVQLVKLLLYVLKGVVGAFVRRCRALYPRRGEEWFESGVHQISWTSIDSYSGGGNTYCCGSTNETYGYEYSSPTKRSTGEEYGLLARLDTVPELELGEDEGGRLGTKRLLVQTCPSWGRRLTERGVCGVIG